MASTQSAIRYDLDRDVRTVEQMAARLTPYVYENELYGLMPGDLPKLTVGGLLMRLHRLSVISDQLSSKQQEVVRAAAKRLDDVRREWPVALENKVQREYQARITALEQFVNECPESPQNCTDNYPPSAEKRTILQALYDEAAAHNYLSDHMRSGLQVLDNKLRRYLQSSDFIWDARLKPAYPSDIYWFLYVR